MEYSSDKYATGTFTFSILKYASKVSDNAEKALIYDVLSYVRAAYYYFGTNDFNAIAEIDEIIGSDYDNSSVPSDSLPDELPTEGLVGATFNLTATPAVRFYIADGYRAEDFAFFINGEKKAVTKGSDSSGEYVELNLYAYEMCELISCEFGGRPIGGYSIASYRAWASTNGSDSLIRLAERFQKYAESARDYKTAYTDN